MPPRVYIYYNGANLAAYRGALEMAGAIPLFSTDFSMIERCDGLLLPGGGDIDPARYGQKPFGKPRLHPEREEMEFRLLEEAVKRKKPVLGICLGLQMMNVFFGGTLSQLVLHHGPESSGKDRLHAVQNAPDTPLYTAYGENCVVNSCHRQAVEQLGAGLEAIQWVEDGVVEGVWHKELPLLGVQWHPERISGILRRKGCADGVEVFRWFVKQMG